MRRVSCDNCGKIYTIDNSKLPNSISRVACKACGNSFIVEKEVDASDLDSSIDNTSDLGAVADLSEEPSSPTESQGIDASTNISWINRIQVRISATLIFITTLVLVGYAVLNYQIEKNTMNNEIGRLAEVTATRLSNQLVEPFWALDDQLLQEAVQSEMMNKQVSAIIIRDKNDKDIYLGRTRNAKWKVTDTRNEIKDKLLVKRTKDLIKGKNRIGSVDVYLTLKFMEEELKRSTIYMIITVLVLDLILFLSIYTILRRSIIQPIMNLTNAAEQISTGNLNVTFSHKTNDEIGLLVKAFQRMQTSLDFAMKRLGRR
ncbi:MAG: HAMP domain-containing protein [Desulfobacteraceae bacterium]|nr:MAG: HAMP domain-containing protein [Desulfobacteraceae bacterium]